MRVSFHADAAAIRAGASAFWLRDEPMNNLVISLATRYSAPGTPPPMPERCTFASLEDAAGEVVGTAFRTPPNALVLSGMPAEAIEPLVAAIERHDPTLDAVMGPTASADAFGERWCARAGTEPRGIMHEGVYALETLSEPRWASGALREAGADDKPLLAAWLRAFAVDAHLPALDVDPLALAERHLAARALFLWEDGGRPVAMAARSGTTPNGARLGAVYTPRELRGRGYASSCTAALTRHLLGEGRRFCFLFTDLANPTSNGIYRRLGYRQVGEFRWWGLGAPAR
jgi:hypothetical protein